MLLLTFKEFPLWQYHETAHRTHAKTRDARTTPKNRKMSPHAPTVKARVCLIAFALNVDFMQDAR